ncbi:MAG: hypothetical protein Q4G67_14000, partial [Actinomycetia bacterium]|nr:hypothetical protein [Actinomycetes bacterium]
QMGAVLGSAAIAVLMEARISALVPGADSSASTVQHTEGGPMPEPVRALFAQALSDAMLLPAVMVLVGFVAALFFERPRHQVTADHRSVTRGDSGRTGHRFGAQTPPAGDAAPVARVRGHDSGTAAD